MSEDGPIIIKKKNKGHGGHHGGAWKVAYADFVTAMMALFIVLWILGQSQEVKEAVSGYFKDPMGFSTKKGRGLLDQKGGNKMIDMSLQQASSSADQKAAEKIEMAKMGQAIVNELSSSPEFKDLMDQITIEFVDQGMRIEMMESSQNVFFEIGTAELKSSALALLEKIGAQLANLPNQVIIEGHTDSRPYSNSGLGYTNYELSADRANSARRALIMGKLPEKRIDSVVGYADQRLRNISDPYDITNRRISIIVKYN